MINKDYIRILDINLTKQTFEIIKRKDLFEYLGGVGVATKLLAENLKPKKDALDPEQPLIFAIGPLSTIFPTITKTVCMFKSPLTNELGETYAGGKLASAIRFAGFDVIILRGKANDEIYLSIQNDEVAFHNAETIWGLSPHESSRVIRELEGGRGYRSIVLIGRAGEKQVRFANVVVDMFRHFGRLGLGAAFGSKKLKGFIIKGTNSYPIKDFKMYNKVYKALTEIIMDTTMMKKYHDLGTPVNILALNEINALPTRNLQQTSFEHAKEISGENFGDHLLMRKSSCIGCPVGCIHIGLLRREFAPEHEFDFKQISYDYELIYALGSFLGMEKPNDVLELIERVESVGLDAMSTGVALGWATEALEKGVISTDQTIEPLKFSALEPYLKFIDHLVKQKTQFFKDLAMGTEFAAKKYGGQDYAIALGGLEIAGYHTGYASIVGQAIGARHSHLDNAGYALDQKLKGDEPAEIIVEQLVTEEIERGVVNSLIICLFARNIYDLKTVTQMLDAVGINKTEDELFGLGEKIYELKLELKRKMGLDIAKLRLPKRFFETKSFHGKLDEKFVKKMLDVYNKKYYKKKSGKKKK